MVAEKCKEYYIIFKKDTKMRKNMHSEPSRKGFPFIYLYTFHKAYTKNNRKIRPQ
jgi:hypothetical protein